MASPTIFKFLDLLHKSNISLSLSSLLRPLAHRMDEKRSLHENLIQAAVKKIILYSDILIYSNSPSVLISPWFDYISCIATILLYTLYANLLLMEKTAGMCLAILKLNKTLATAEVVWCGMCWRLWRVR